MQKMDKAIFAQLIGFKIILIVKPRSSAVGASFLPFLFYILSGIKHGSYSN